MNNPSESGENLKERLRRVLADNPEPPQVWSPFTADEPMGDEQAEETTATEVGAAAEARLAPYEPVTTGATEAAVEPEAEAEREFRPEEGSRPEEEPRRAGHGHLPGADDYVRLIHQRLRAIHIIQEMEPKQLCAGQRVRELSRALAETPGDSVHYRAMLHQLREVHAEWLYLEEEIAAANHIIRSTQWLVELLAEPPRRGSGE